jgi:transcriptional regulator with XRE-family HTH domain
MVDSLSLASKNLSNNIQALRKIRGISQGTLAKMAGVPRTTVTYLESGAGNPSLSNLIRIAAAFQIGIEELLQKPRAQCQLVKKEAIPVQKRANGSIQLFKLLPDSIPTMVLDRMEFEPGARMGGVPHTPSTKEYFICLKGEIELIVSGTRYRLSEGDVLAFPGDQPHSYHNPGKTRSECMSVVALVPHGFL